MRDAHAIPEARQPAAGSSDYVRFIILSGPRTGSNMLAQALNSGRHITCFREVFNGVMDFIQFDVEGYDNFSSRDIDLRKSEPVRFLNERIFCQHPQEIRAVGFKFHHGQQWFFPGILDELVGDDGIRVLHLRRRNSLRMLISLKLAQQTGVWLQEGAPKATWANLAKALRHPLKAGGRVLRHLRNPIPPRGSAQKRLTISPEELLEFAVQTKTRADNLDKLFQQHPRMPVFYEDMLERRDEVLNEAQSFLDVEPGSLTVTLRRQNPEPLHELIENYDELHAALKDTPQAWLLD